MDDPRFPGDIAQAFPLNDGQLLFPPLSNYLYRFVWVHLSDFERQRIFPSAVETPRRGKTTRFLQPTDAEAFSGKRANITVRTLSEAAVKIEVGRMLLRYYGVSHRGHDCLGLRKYKTESSVWCCVGDKR